MLLAKDGVERPRRTVQGRDPQTPAREGIGEGLPPCGVAQEVVDPKVRGARLAADGDLDAASADFGREVEGSLEREVLDRIGVEAEFHRLSYWTPNRRRRRMGLQSGRSSSRRPATPRS